MLVDFRLKIIAPTIGAYEHNQKVVNSRLLPIPYKRILQNDQSNADILTTDIYMRTYKQSMQVCLFGAEFRNWINDLKGYIEFVSCLPQRHLPQNSEIRALLCLPTQYTHTVKTGKKILPTHPQDLDFYYKTQDAKFWEYIQNGLYEKAKPQPKPIIQPAYEQISLF